MTTPRPTSVESLARSWDDFVHGNPPDPEMSASDSELLRLLHRADQQLDADPGFVTNLQRDLLQTWKPESDHPWLVVKPVLPARPDQVVPAAPTRSSRWPRPTFPQSGVLATAALLLLTFVSAFAMLASTWQASFVREHMMEPILAPIVHDPATTMGVLAAFRVPELPQTLGRMLVERWTYPPHAEAITTEKLTGPLLLYVIKGEVVVALTGGEAVLLGEDGRPLNPLLSLNTSTGRISAGQALLLPAQTQMTTSNGGDDEAIVLAASAYADTMTDWTLPYGQTIIKQETLGSTFATFPIGPAELTLQRSMLAPGESFPPPPEGTIQLVSSESRYLAYLRRAPDGAVTNLETEPLRILIATITPGGGGGGGGIGG